MLNKLNHPNIVVMFGTFQDEGSLYYHMEFCAGGELWGLTREKDGKSGLYSMVGIHLSLLQFYVAGEKMTQFESKIFFAFRVNILGLHLK